MANDTPALQQLWRVIYETDNSVFLVTASRDVHVATTVAQAFSQAEIDSLTYVGEVYVP